MWFEVCLQIRAEQARTFGSWLWPSGVWYVRESLQESSSFTQTQWNSLFQTFVPSQQRRVLITLIITRKSEYPFTEWHCEICNKYFVSTNVEESRRIHMASHETKCFIEKAPEEPITIPCNSNHSVIADHTTNQKKFPWTEWECHICKKVFTGTEEAKRAHFATHESRDQVIKLEWHSSTIVST